MSHRRFCLVLLHSCPDTVHRFLLHETQTSSPLIEGSSAAKSPRIGITPAVADCRYRAPLSPRLRGLNYYIVNPPFCQVATNYLKNPRANNRMSSYPTARLIFCPLSIPALLIPITSPCIFKTAPPELP